MTLLADAAPVFAALGDPTRLSILTALGDTGPLTAARLAATRPISRQAVEKHLAHLATAGLVASERRGRERWWTVDARAIGDAGDAVRAAASRWDAALLRLRDYVERG